MSSSKLEIDDAAAVISQELVAHPDTPYTLHQLQDLTGLLDKSSVRTAIKRAEPLIAEAGLFMPVAIGSNVYIAAAVDPEPVFRGYRHLNAMERGVRRRKMQHVPCLTAHIDSLSEMDRLIFLRQKAFDEEMAERQTAHEVAMAAIEAARRKRIRAERQAEKARQTLQAIDAELAAMN